jgi:hypothetical protein
LRIGSGWERIATSYKKEFKSEPLTNSDDGDRSEEEEIESGEANSLVVRPRGTAGSEVPEEAGTSARVQEVRKRTVEDDAASIGEAKRARVEEHRGCRRCCFPCGGARVSQGNTSARRHAQWQWT